MRHGGFHVDIAHRRGQITRGLFGGITDPQPVAHVEGQRDGQCHFPTGGLEALHRRELSTVGLIVLHDQRHAACVQQATQGVERLRVAEMAQGNLQPQGVQGAGLREIAGQIRVEGAVGHKQGGGGGVARQQAEQLNGFSQRRQRQQLFAAEQFPADLHAVCPCACNHGKHRPLTACLSHLFRTVRGGDHHNFPAHLRTPSQHNNTITLDGTGSKEKVRMSNL